MKTFFPSPSDITRAWYLVDAKDLTLGKLAVKLANVLRGRHKASFSPHLDTGDFVVVINARHLVVSGNKAADKQYYSHSGHFGHLKQTSLTELLEKNPCRVVELAVRGMMPKNKLRDVMMKKLKIYPEASHPHEAQKPSILSLD